MNETQEQIKRPAESGSKFGAVFFGFWRGFTIALILSLGLFFIWDPALAIVNWFRGGAEKIARAFEFFGDSGLYLFLYVLASIVFAAVWSAVAGLLYDRKRYR